MCAKIRLRHENICRIKIQMFAAHRKENRMGLQAARGKLEFAIYQTDLLLRDCVTRDIDSRAAHT